MDNQTTTHIDDKPIDVFICDADGTIVDTINAMIESFNYALTSHERVIEREAALEVIRRSHNLEMCFSKLLSTDDMAICTLLAGKYRQHFGTIIGSAIARYPGVDTGLEKLGKHGIPVGIVSTRVAYMEETLRHCGILHLIDKRAIITGDMVDGKHKPDPFGVRLALERLDAKPARAAFAGDTRTDMQAAKDAGIPLRFYLRWGYGDKECPEATHTVDSFAEILAHLFAERPRFP